MGSVDITIWANYLLKPKLTHGEDTVGVDMDMEDITVKFVYHGSDIYENYDQLMDLMYKQLTHFGIQFISIFTFLLYFPNSKLSQLCSIFCQPIKRLESKENK